MLIPALILLFLLLWVLMTLPRLPRRDMSSFTGRLYAHRGLWNNERPENSMAAFRAAADAGYGMETDVHLTKDGVPVLHHDGHTGRMCGTDLRICDCTLAELQALQLKETQETIPTLDEFLDMVDGRVPLILELKTDDGNHEALCPVVLERLRRYKGLWCMESFDPKAVRWFRLHAPDVIRGQLSTGLHNEKLSWQRLAMAMLLQNVQSRPDFVAFDHKAVHCPALWFHRLIGTNLVAWTVRTQADLDRNRSRFLLQIFDSFVPRDGIQ